MQEPRPDDRFFDADNSKWQEAVDLANAALIQDPDAILSPAQSVALNLGNLRYQIDNGGVSQWFLNNPDRSDFDGVVQALLTVDRCVGAVVRTRSNELLSRLERLTHDDSPPALEGFDEFFSSQPFRNGWDCEVESYIVSQFSE